MGSGIATAFLLAGYTVTMVERDEEALKRGQGTVAKNLAGARQRGKLTAARHAEIEAGAFSGATSVDALADADLVIEAAFEDMDVKKDLFTRLDRVAKPGAILATNTSYLDVDAIAAVTGRPADVIGLHFFSPAHVMRLLEVVVADKTAADVVATGFAVAKRLGKVAVRAGVCDGFIGNRILSHYRKAAEYLVMDGASPAEVDRALEDFGFAMGPHAVFDLAGLDIALGLAQAPRPHPAAGGALRRDRGPAVRGGPVRPQDRPRLLPLRRRRGGAAGKPGRARHHRRRARRGPTSPRATSPPMRSCSATSPP